MTTTFTGGGFLPNSDWYIDELKLIANIHNQIDSAFPNSQNLFVNTTWVGPQFNNGRNWKNYKSIISQQKFDRIFLLSGPEAVLLTQDQIDNIQIETQAKMYLLGNFDSEYYFNFFSQVLPQYFVSYTEQQLQLVEPTYLYISYNRKPREHRIVLVNQLIEQNLLHHGIVTLGKQNTIYSKEMVPLQHLSLNETPEDVVGNWKMNMEFGIPHDIHSLGNLNIWQQHFLNVIGETEFLPWDNMFLTEKTWKPILGLRPFIINGQTKIYQYLRSQGFRTFNHYWPHIDIEGANELEVPSTIVQVIDYLKDFNKTQLQDMYQQMLPDLIHNRNHFWEYSQQQKYKIDNLFK